MKKIFTFLFVIMCSVGAKGQTLGDYMEIDGVPGFVFYVDESGEHGLVMSYEALNQKQVKKASKDPKKIGISMDALKKLGLPEPSKNISFKDRKKTYEGFVPLLGADGEQNTIIIRDYCKDNNLSLMDYFPAYYWVSQLGNGWFIPGENELVKFAQFYTGGVGKEYKISGVGGFQKRSKELSNDAFVQRQLYLSTFYGGLLSSSMKDSEHGFIGLIHMSQHGLKTAEWFELDDRATVKSGKIPTKKSFEALKYSIVAVRKF